VTTDLACLDAASNGEDGGWKSPNASSKRGSTHCRPCAISEVSSAQTMLETVAKGGVEGQSLLANEVLLVAASDDAGGWLRDTGGWLPTRRDGLGGWL